MTTDWLHALEINPLLALKREGDPALNYFVKRDLLEESAQPVYSLWDLAEPAQLESRQGENGSWRYPGKSIDPISGENYYLLETYRSLGVLVEMYGFEHCHPAILKAAEFVLSCQTEEGDIRGILGNQYMPYYHAAILELLIKAGFHEDMRVKKGLDWLLEQRQEDGGWIVPTQAIPTKQRTRQFWNGPPEPPQRSMPSSHLATGMVIRAFAAHTNYRSLPEVFQAARLLKSRFFTPDAYNDRKAPAYWLKFQYPFWWSNLLTCLDSLSRLGFDQHDQEIARALDWFLTNQCADGLWETGYGKAKGADRIERWVGLAICRVLKLYL